jgi:trehalose/maltose hydrolase-like predicted phosphorylase
VNYPELQQYGCESVISGTPYPLSLHLVVGDRILNSTTADEKTVQNYKQSLRFQDGLTQWSYTWAPGSTNLSFDIAFAVFMSRVRPNVAATQLRVTPLGGNCTAKILDLLDGRSAKRSFLGQKGMSNSTPSIYVSSHPNGLPNVEAWTVSSANIPDGYAIKASRQIAPLTESPDSMTIGQQWGVHLIDGETAVFQKFIGIASSDKFENASFTAHLASARALEDGWDKLLLEHTKAWNNLMRRNFITGYRDPRTGKLPENDSIIEKFQIAAVADLYFIMQNLLPEVDQNLNDNGISVGGLTSDDYGGMLLWDQELWMYPPIAICDPQYARQVLKSRLKLFPQAKKNTQMLYVKYK